MVEFLPMIWKAGGYLLPNLPIDLYPPGFDPHWNYENSIWFCLVHQIQMQKTKIVALLKFNEFEMECVVLVGDFLVKDGAKQFNWFNS